MASHQGLHPMGNCSRGWQGPVLDRDRGRPGLVSPSWSPHEVGAVAVAVLGLQGTGRGSQKLCDSPEVTQPASGESNPFYCTLRPGAGNSPQLSG